MKYTFSEEGDKKVHEDLDIICEEIRKEVPETISIILTGGFSRGEGAVKIKNKKATPYNDYDIQIVTKKKISKEKTDKIATELANRLGYKGILNLFYPFKKGGQSMENNFYIDLKCDTPKELKRLLPRIRTYELRNNSLLFYGKDIREIIPNYPLKELPLSEGAKLLLDRMSQMVEYYSTENKYEKEFLTYIIQQTYAACCTSLLLLSRKYEIGYKKSMEILKDTYKEDFPELYAKVPDLPKKVEQFIKWKINPQKLPNENVEEEWFIAKENILEVSKYFFSKFLKKEINTIDELSAGILNMRKEFYMPYINEMIKHSPRLDWTDNIPIWKEMLVAGASLFLKIKYNKRLKERGINYKVHKSPDLVIFSSLIYLIGSISKNEIDNDMLTKGKDLLNHVYPVKGKDWEDISKDYANAYIAFFLQKIS
jgi:hypothetical protein